MGCPRSDTIRTTSKEVVGTRALRRHSFFGGGILRRLLPRALPGRPTSALLQFSQPRTTKPRFGSRQRPRRQETHHAADVIRHTKSALQIFPPVLPPRL